MPRRAALFNHPVMPHRLSLVPLPASLHRQAATFAALKARYLEDTSTPQVAQILKGREEALQTYRKAGAVFSLVLMRPHSHQPADESGPSPQRRPMNELLSPDG